MVVLYLFVLMPAVGLFFGFIIGFAYANRDTRVPMSHWDQLYREVRKIRYGV